VGKVTEHPNLLVNIGHGVHFRISVTETRNSRLYIRRNIKTEFRETGCERVEDVGGIHLAQDTDKYHAMLDRH
jgi:hypothetical protein